MGNVFASLPVRIAALCIGVVLIPAFGVFFIAAWVHMPETWMGVLYACYGLAAGICGIIYFFKKKVLFLVIMLPAAVLMALTWSGVYP